MKRILNFLFTVATLISCQKNYVAPKPELEWDLFTNPQNQYLDSGSINAIEGVYSVLSGQDDFGDEVVIKGSVTIEGVDSSYNLSIFCKKGISLFICSGKYSGNRIYLYGTWRKLENTETGTVRLVIEQNSGASQILNGSPVDTSSILIDGHYGSENNIPDKEFRLMFNRNLKRDNNFQLIAHRGGGRTSDLLNVSENSLEIIKKASQFGATGVEIDVRLTSDGIPVLYHDANINPRLTQSNGMLGPLENYSYAQISGLVRLINGEKIPTLREALGVILYNTMLEYVWIDIKYEGSLSVVREIQKEFIEKSTIAGRSLQILIGIPGEEQLNNFRMLPDHLSAPSICELSVDEARLIQSLAWAPRWTQGLLPTEVSQMHSEGRKCITWTLDVPDYIDQFISEGDFDGILTNYTSLVAFYEYSK